MRTLLLIAIVAVTASCGASLGAPYQRAPMPSDPLKSVVYIYRPKKFSAGKLAVQTGLIQEQQAWTLQLNNGAYIPYVADAGRLIVMARHGTGAGQIELSVQPQKEYFVRITVDAVTVKEMSPADGAAEIRETKYEPSSDHKKPVRK